MKVIEKEQIDQIREQLAPKLIQGAPSLHVYTTDGLDRLLRQVNPSKGFVSRLCAFTARKQLSDLYYRMKGKNLYSQSGIFPHVKTK